MSGEGAAAQMNWGMKRALEAFQEAILMVDTSKDTWTVLHVNSAFTQQTGKHLPLVLCCLNKWLLDVLFSSYCLLATT